MKKFIEVLLNNNTRLIGMAEEYDSFIELYDPMTVTFGLNGIGFVPVLLFTKIEKIKLYKTNILAYGEIKDIDLLNEYNKVLLELKAKRSGITLPN